MAKKCKFIKFKFTGAEMKLLIAAELDKRTISGKELAKDTSQCGVSAFDDVFQQLERPDRMKRNETVELRLEPDAIDSLSFCINWSMPVFTVTERKEALRLLSRLKKALPANYKTFAEQCGRKLSS